MGAAMTPPVGQYVSAFSVSSDRLTGSFHSPPAEERPTQFVHQIWVRSSSRQASTGTGAARRDGAHARTKGTSWLRSTENSEVVAKRSP